jgi:LmbE family N-acetylglucosaminyl deacetylase
MRDIDPNQTFPGRIVIVAPHMDDEALACGGLIASLRDKERIQLVYATDGMKSPAPVIPGDAISPDLGEARVKEAVEAMTHLGVPGANLHFLRLPEGELSRNLARLKAELLPLLDSLRPDFLFIPFRFDRHPDHLAINQVVMGAVQGGTHPAQVIEYFVYYRWRLLPKGDIRAYIRSDCLHRLDIAAYSGRKREALDRFTSQTTIYYPWQTRPILTPILLNEECVNPEYFLFSDPDMSGARVFTHLTPWIRIAHRLEPLLQRWNYLVGVYLKKALVKNG